MHISQAEQSAFVSWPASLYYVRHYPKWTHVVLFTQKLRIQPQKFVTLH